MGKFRYVNKLLRIFLNEDIMRHFEKIWNQCQRKWNKCTYGWTLKENSFGEKNDDKKFYIIGKEVDNWGILTSYTHFMQECKWAMQHRYIPVIDLQNYYMLMSQDKEKAYQENAWDYYFLQPYPEYSLDEVYSSKHVVKGTYSDRGFANTFNDYGIRTKDIKKLGPLVRRYMDFKPYLWERAQEFLKERLVEGKKVLAINVRANFLWGQLLDQAVYENHPRCLPLEEYIKIAEKYMKEWGCDYIFVSSDDREWYNTFQKRFGSQCFLEMERERTRFFKEGDPVSIEDKEYIHYEYQNVSVRKRTEDYLTEVCIVALCNCLVSTISSISNIALLHNNHQYEHVEIINSGVIHIK